jgi:hypothetical protein
MKFSLVKAASSPGVQDERRFARFILTCPTLEIVVDGAEDVAND